MESTMLFLHHCPVNGEFHPHYIVMDTIIPYFDVYANDHQDIVGYNNNGPSLIVFNEDDDIVDISWGKHDITFTKTSDYCKAYNLSDEDTFFFTMTYGEELPDLLEDLHPMHNPILNMSVHTVLIEYIEYNDE